MSGVVGQFEQYPSPGKTIDGKKRKKQPLNEMAATDRRVTELEEPIAERTATEAALRKLSADHQVIFDSVPAMIWSKDRHNNFIRVNRAAASALGMSAGEIEGRSAFELFPDEGEKYYQDDLEVITSGEPRIGIVEKMQIAGGEKIWVRTDKIPSRDEEGNVTGVMVFVVDITDIKKADEAVRESEHKFRDLAEKSLVGIYLVQDGIFKYVNSHLAEIHGYTAEELIDKKGPKDLSFPDDWPMIEEKLRKRISDDADSFHYEFRTLTRTGDIRNIEAYGSRSVFRGSPAVVGTLLDVTERKRTEAALRQNEERLDAAVGLLQALIEAIPNPIFYRDDRGIYRGCNKAFEALIGHPREKIIGSSVYDLAPRELAEKYEETDVALLCEGGTQVYETLVRYADGTLHNVIINKAPFANPDGSNGGLVGTIIDITKRKKAEESLAESEERYRMAIEESNDGVSLLKGGKHIYVNGKFLEIFGYDGPEEVLGKGHILTVHPDDLKMVMEYQRKRETGEETPSRYEFRGVRKDGATIHIEVSAARMTFRGDTVTLVYFRDVTQRKQQEEALRESEGRYRVLFERSTFGILMTDIGTGRFVDANVSICRMLGYSKAELLQLGIADIHPKDSRDRLTSEIESQARGGQQASIAISCLRKDGTVFYADIAGANTIFHGRKCVVGFLIDITERKQADEALRASQQMIEGIINAIPVRVFWKDENLVYLGCNAVFARDAGFADPKDIIGKDDYQMGWRDQAELYRGDDRQVIESGCSKLLIEEPQTTPDGNTITLLTSKIPLRSSDGEISGLLGTYMDITERKQAEEALHRSETKFRTLYDSTSDAAMLVDETGLFLDCNKATLAIFGCAAPEEFCRKHPADLSPPQQLCGTDSVVLANQMIATAMEKGSIHFEWTHKRNDTGETFPADVLLTAMELDGKTVVQAVVRDITERKGLEARLQTMSVVDELTGLYNRRGFLTLCQQQLKMADRTKESILFLFADLDRMKWINDTLGHQTGDRALAETAGILKQTFRESDIIGRMGGDEFAVLAIGITDETPEVVTARLHGTTEAFNKSGARAYVISLSIGVVRYDPEKPCSLDALMAQADGLMYEEKRKNSGNALSADGGRLAPSGSGVKRGSKAFSRHA
jgi:diguanylate cyclase (GGDEF)-like protein/PAS domain S-box-containing protein